MFSKLLIANRGEIALRILRSCRELGIRTVAVHSTADNDALHVRLADEAVCIGPPDPRQSYLNFANIISAAEITHTEAIHPGYGFLAENADFGEACENCNIKFIGPSAKALRLAGDKALTRQIMAEAGIPILAGSAGPTHSIAEAEEVARRVGYPVMIKAKAGGGGRGMRACPDEPSLRKNFSLARSEALSSFGVPDVYVEKLLPRAKHVEVQVLADETGHIIHLGERDCTIQRRRQKLIEESPSPALSSERRAALLAAGVMAAKAVEYSSAGTVEFLLDPEENFHFIELNARIQVEHPVTEMVTGLDLVREQIAIAAGQPLRWDQEEIVFQGHSIECRVNAEDPTTFAPTPGLIRNVHFPGGPGVRCDTAVYPQYTVPPFYDSLLAKLIVRGPTRPDAIAKMIRVLDECHIDGITTNLSYLRSMVGGPVFQAGEHYIEQ